MGLWVGIAASSTSSSIRCGHQFCFDGFEQEAPRKHLPFTTTQALPEEETGDYQDSVTGAQLQNGLILAITPPSVAYSCRAQVTMWECEAVVDRVKHSEPAPQD